MNLRAFIRNNMDAIVDEGEVFAKTLLPVAGTMSSLALRDHCRIRAGWADRSEPPPAHPAQTAA